MRYIRKYQRFVAFLLVFVFTNSLIPQLGFSITGHSSMPEYRSFEPVSSSNMVNVFDGSFTYNIPLLDVPNGYPINLSYHSNAVNNEAQATWVGLGWSLNPGAINRAKRGYPDEFDGERVTYHSRRQDVTTTTANFGVTAEVFSILEGNDEIGIRSGLSTTIRYNNYTGFSRVVGTSLGDALGIASLGLDYSTNGGFGFNSRVNPFQIQRKLERNALNNEAKREQESSELFSKLAENVPDLPFGMSEAIKSNLSSMAASSKARSEKAKSEMSKVSVSSTQIGFSYGGLTGGSSFNSSTYNSSGVNVPLATQTGSSFTASVQFGLIFCLLF